MKRRSFLAFFLGLCLVGCGSTAKAHVTSPSPGTGTQPSSSPTASPSSSTTASPSSSATASPSQSPTPSPGTLVSGGYAVLVSSLSPQGSYTLRIVDTSGRSLASATATARTAIFVPNGTAAPAPSVFFPVASASRTRVYYLEGDSAVRSLGLDGKTSLVTHVPGSTTVKAGFAVSPDDSRIAVSTIDYSVNPQRLRLYVENLVGGGNHVEIFASSSLYVWPIAWKGPNLVLAVGPTAAQYAAPNPYDAIYGYHLANAATANRVSAICASPATGEGPVASTGSICLAQDGSLFLQRWDGSQKALPNDCGTLSPSGTFAACGGGGGPIAILNVVTGVRTPTTASGWGFLGWIDDQHLIYAASTYRTDNERVLDVTADMSTTIGQGGEFETRFGGNG